MCYMVTNTVQIRAVTLRSSRISTGELAGVARTSLSLDVASLDVDIQNCDARNMAGVVLYAHGDVKISGYKISLSNFTVKEHVVSVSQIAYQHVAAADVVVDLVQIRAKWIVGLVVHVGKTLTASECQVTMRECDAAKSMHGLSYDVNDTTVVEGVGVSLDEINSKWINGIAHKLNAETTITNSQITLSHFSCSDYINGVFLDAQSQLSFDNVTVQLSSGTGNHTNGVGENIKGVTSFNKLSLTLHDVTASWHVINFITYVNGPLTITDSVVVDKTVTA